MEILIAAFGIKFTIDEAKEFIQEISGAFHKDKKYICVLVHFTTLFLIDWYNKISTAFMPTHIGSFKDLSDEKKEEIYNFMTQLEFGPLADTLDKKVDILLNEYYSRQSEVIDADDVLLLKKLKNNIYSFRWFSIHEREWYRELRNRNFDSVDLDEVRRSIDKLLEIANDTNTNVWLKIEPKLDCSQNDMRNIVRKYKEGRGL